jgi:hypothetical protein
MSANALAESLSDLREQSERLWSLSDKSIATEYILEARSIAAALDEVAERIEAVLTQRS